MQKLTTVTLLSAALLLPACKTTTANVAAAGPTYAADAGIKVKPNKTGIGAITLTIEHLAPPKRIDKSYAGYVAWLIVKGQPPVKLGMLEYNEKKRRGVLHASTPQKTFTLQVTIEKGNNIQAPTGTVIINHPLTVKY